MQWIHALDGPYRRRVLITPFQDAPPPWQRLWQDVVDGRSGSVTRWTKAFANLPWRLQRTWIRAHGCRLDITAVRWGRATEPAEEAARNEVFAAVCRQADISLEDALAAPLPHFDWTRAGFSRLVSQWDAWTVHERVDMEIF